jgi:hypothetical protein
MKDRGSSSTRMTSDMHCIEKEISYYNGMNDEKGQ